MAATVKFGVWVGVGLVFALWWFLKNPLKPTPSENATLLGNVSQHIFPIGNPDRHPASQLKNLTCSVYTPQVISGQLPVLVFFNNRPNVQMQSVLRRMAQELSLIIMAYPMTNEDEIRYGYLVENSHTQISYVELFVDWAFNYAMKHFNADFNRAFVGGDHWGALTSFFFAIKRMDNPRYSTLWTAQILVNPFLLNFSTDPQYPFYKNLDFPLLTRQAINGTSTEWGVRSFKNFIPTVIFSDMKGNSADRNVVNAVNLIKEDGSSAFLQYVPAEISAKSFDIVSMRAFFDDERLLE